MSFVNLKNWLACLASATLVACGGGGSAGNNLFGGGGSGPAASDLQIKFTPTSVDNTGTQNVTATITALDSSGRGVQGVLLALSVDKNATFSITGTTGSTTAADGTVTANVTIGNDYSTRTITMTASSGAVTRSSSFDVTGGRLVASDLILTLSSPTIPNTVSNVVTATATAVDANRNALSGIPITLSVDNGATVMPSGSTTAGDGNLTGAVKIGSDRSNRAILVTATSGSVSRVVALQVIGAKLSASGVASVLGTGTAASVKYLLVDNTGAKMAGYPISVKSSDQTTATQGVTSADGEFVFAFTTPSTAGTLNIVASAGGQQDIQNIDIQAVATVPPATLDVASASVSSNPSVVTINTVGAPTNSVEIRALFLAANNAPVKNVRVWFDLNGDKQSIGGTLDSTQPRVFLYSDANGVARTTYAPGPRFSPKDGVTVRACWANDDFAIPSDGGACASSVTTTLTVISESLSVSIGTNATLDIGPSGLTYIKRYVVQVVDSAGQAKRDVQIAPSIDLLQYYKGSWEPGASKWEQGGRGNSYPATYPGSNTPVAAMNLLADTSTATWTAGDASICDNEDLNRNGVAENFLDTNENALVPEDQNGSGSLSPQRPKLDPRKADVTITAEGSSSTDANGIVVLKIEYPQNIGSWVEFNILVSASGVAGTEGRANYLGVLPVLAAAVNKLTEEPAFRVSPYGVMGSPAFKRTNPEGQSGWLCTNPN